MTDDVSRHCPECERLAARVERLEEALRTVKPYVPAVGNLHAVIDAALAERGQESEEPNGKE